MAKSGAGVDLTENFSGSSRYLAFYGESGRL